MRLRSRPGGACCACRRSAGAAFAQEAAPSRPAAAGDKSQGEEEQIRQREEWFALSRGLKASRRPDLLARGGRAASWDGAGGARLRELERPARPGRRWGRRA